MGTMACQSRIVERCVLSIRRGGNWNGPIILLTDAPPERYKALVQLQQQQQVQHQGTTSTTSSSSNNNSLVVPQLIILHPRLYDYNWNTTAVPGDLFYKRFKTMLLEYTNLDPQLDSIELIYYLDVDIVVGAPLEYFFDYIETKYEIGTTTSRTTSIHSSSSNGGGGGGGGGTHLLDIPTPTTTTTPGIPTTTTTTTTTTTNIRTNNKTINSPPLPRPTSISDDNNDDDDEISTIYFFKGNYKKSPVQGGQFIVERQPIHPRPITAMTTNPLVVVGATNATTMTSYHQRPSERSQWSHQGQHRRPSSQFCLRQWRQLMDENSAQTTKDQVSLKQLYYQTINNNNNNHHHHSKNHHHHHSHPYQKEQQCQFVIMEQLPHLVFPDKRYMKKIVNQSNKKKMKNEVMMSSSSSFSFSSSSSQFVTLNHIKNTQFAKKISPQIQHDFLMKLLQLDDNDGCHQGEGKNKNQEDDTTTTTILNEITSQIVFHENTNITKSLLLLSSSSSSFQEEEEEEEQVVGTSSSSFICN